MITRDTELELEVIVRRRIQASDRVLALDLAAVDGGRLPAWQPGAHIDVRAGADRIRQYSLVSDPADRGSWRIAVLHEPDGRGGSRWLHDEAVPGARLRIRGPRNHFSLDPARHYIFLAAGIGITPMLAMIGEAERTGTTWELHFGGRALADMAFAVELRGRYPASVHLYPRDDGPRMDLAAVLANPARGTLIYACGPRPYLRSVDEAGASWLPGAVRSEHFVPREVGEPVLKTSFEVDLLVSGLTLTVPPDRSILQVAEDHGVLVLSSCQEGTCGTCETPVLDGIVDHRDSVLTPQEQADNEVMMICVSRAACPRLVLGL